jgi:HEAT repeat protein
MADGEDFADLIAQLHGPRSEHVFFTLISLPQSYPFVAAACRDERRPERRAVLIRCLWQYRDHAAIATLASALQDVDDRVWKEALDGLVTLGGAEAERVLRDARASLVGEDAQTKAEWFDEAIEQIGDALRAPRKGPDSVG